jgi:hypothetical protein
MTPGIRVEVGDPERPVFADDQAEDAMALRQRADPTTRGVVHPAGDESFDPATGIDDAEGGVLGIDERADLVDDDLQDVVDGAETRDPADRCVKGSLDLVLGSLLGPRRLAHPGEHNKHAFGRIEAGWHAERGQRSLA